MYRRQVDSDGYISLLQKLLMLFIYLLFFFFWSSATEEAKFTLNKLSALFLGCLDNFT